MDRAGRILAGNKTLAQARALDLPVETVQTEGERLVVVQRVDLDLDTDVRARQLALADNRIAELDLDWDDDVLRDLLEEGIVKLKLTAVLDAQHGGFTTGWSPVSWGSIDELFVNLTMPLAIKCPRKPWGAGA